MKRHFLAAILILSAAVAGRATEATYYNGGVVTTPPMIDATNFVNEGLFEIATERPFEFSSVLNYTNRNVMRNGYLDGYLVAGGVTVSVGAGGFRFDTAPPTDQSWTRHPAANFFNAPLVGNIATNATIYGDFQLLVQATNIVNHGALRVSEYGLVSLEGKNVDASRGVLQTADFGERGPTIPEGIYDRYWYFGTNILHPDEEFMLNYPYTPIYDVITFPNYLTNSMALSLYEFGLATNSLNSAEFIYEAGTNRTVQIVFVRNPNPNITTRIVSYGGSSQQVGIPIIEWAAVNTNAAGIIQSNALYLTDTYGYDTTNAYITNYPYSPPPPNNRQVLPRSFQPENFFITRAAPIDFDLAFAGTPFTDKPGSFWDANGSPVTISNALYSAYGVTATATPTTSETATAVRGGSGRVEIRADRVLDTSLAQVEALSYIKLQATNHFVNNSNGAISAPYADVALGSTNGTLDLSHVLQPYLTRCNGTIDIYSAVWTNNVIVGGSTNAVKFHVLLVDSLLNDRVPMQIYDLSLRATNLFIGDSLYALTSLSLDADRLTVTTNGGIGLGSVNIQWDTSAPHLKSLTNSGAISAANTINFISHNTNGTTRPYDSFVNYGSVGGAGVTVTAGDIYNSGSLSSLHGPLTLQATTNITLPLGGVLSAPEANLNIACRNFFVTNTLTAGRTLSLSISNQLSSGTNSWQVFDGVSFPITPVSGDLNFVTLTSKAIVGQNAVHLWPGADRGASKTGFTNNVALGMLVLDGAVNSQFTFMGNGAASNALYVDRLELTNNASTLDAQGNLAELSINPGMTIYYAQATFNGASAAEFLNGKNGGRLVWVSSQAGYFSGTNVVYPDGTTNFLNTALVTSCNLDSDNDGIPNCVDPSPVFIPQLARVTASVVFTPERMLALSWLTIGGATNHIYSATNTAAPTWQLMTNLVSPPVVGKPFTNQFLTPLGSDKRFYRVNVEAPE